MTQDFPETGPEFEGRVLGLARAIHDPMGGQGSEVYEGRERDSIFVNESQIHVYEATTLRTKEKAERDGQKLVDLMKSLAAKSEHQYRSVSGWFVTRAEPTPDQRTVINNLARKHSVPLRAISASTLMQRICNSEMYLQQRDGAPFGSIAYAPAASGASFRVDVGFQTLGSTSRSLRDVANGLLEGRQMVLTGDFGVGKSHGLRELYRTLRRDHFKNNKLTRFPLHINLRDCVGLRTPAEILRRHAEEIGFQDERSLISAWRSGGVTLLLDGFDEIVPVRWMGSAADLRGVRWEAMASIRRLVDETPPGTGIVVCGRPNYFSSDSEMKEALGVSADAISLHLADFDQQQIEEYLRRASVDWQVPDWIPGRPLLLGYLASMHEVSGDSGDMDRSRAWRDLLRAICLREARMFSAVRAETIEAIISRVATLARSAGNEIGPVGMDLMRTAFIAVNNRQPDEEGLQLLLRLPGLAVDGGSDGEARVFVDVDFADTAYGIDLAGYIMAPHSEHPLGAVASWVTAASELGVAVAADVVSESGHTAPAVLAVATARENSGKFDAILADVLRVASRQGIETNRVTQSYLVEGVIFDEIDVSGDDPVLASIRFADCMFHRVDLGSAEQGSMFPTFQRGIVGLLDGVTSLPAWLEQHFQTVEIERFSQSSHTTSGIMQMNLSSTDKIALSVLKKIYGQRGSGRKEGALTRGLDLSLREHVPGVVAEMISEGWIIKNTAGKGTIYVPVKNRRADAMRALEAPGDFRLRR